MRIPALLALTAGLAFTPDAQACTYEGSPAGYVGCIYGEVQALWDEVDALWIAVEAEPESPRVVTGVATADGWAAYGDDGLVMVVDTSEAGFIETPHYFTSLYGTTSHWTVTGTTSIYSATPDQFVVYLKFTSPITPEDAVARGYDLHWMAAGN